MRNKIYGAFNITNKTASRYFANHPTIISNRAVNSFNSYINSGDIELSCADIEPLAESDYKDEFIKNEAGNEKKGWVLRPKKERQLDNIKEWGQKAPGDKMIGGLSRGVRSIFNKFHAVPLENSEYGVRISQNMPLLDCPSTRKLQRASNACSVRDLVDKSRQGLMGACVYDYSDFMFCKYLGRVPNNYMITLRRFTIPVNDYIKPYGNANAIQPNDPVVRTQVRTSNGGVSMGCMVTWLGTPGNEMNEIMKYNFSMPFKSVDAKFEDDGAAAPNPSNPNSKGAIGGLFGAAMSSSVVRGLAARGLLGRGLYNPQGGQTVSTPPPHYDPQKAYVGVDMIKSIYIRDPDKGLRFEHKFKLTFDYELRSYDGINGRQAMLDLLGNILTVCYTTGDFWPGAYRHNQGGSYVQPMSSLECMKHHKTFTGYMKAFQRDVVKFKAGLKAAAANPIETLLRLLDNIGGLILGGEDESLPPTFGSGRNALLSDNPVGFWHVTIGNPCAPMMSIGNMILENCTVEHYGPLGLDDFPTSLRVTCELVGGKPRDKRLIERIYVSGNDRIYMPLDQDVIKMIRNAENINKFGTVGQKNKTNTATNSSKPESQAEITKTNQAASNAYVSAFKDANLQTVNHSSTQEIMEGELDTNKLIRRMFGNIGASTSFGVVIAAGEMAEGAPKGKEQQDSAMEAPKVNPASASADAAAEMESYYTQAESETPS